MQIFDFWLISTSHEALHGSKCCARLLHRLFLTCVQILKPRPPRHHRPWACRGDQEYPPSLLCHNQSRVHLVKISFEVRHPFTEDNFNNLLSLCSLRSALWVLITCCALQAACEVQQLIFSNKTSTNEKPQVVRRHTVLMDQESKTCVSLIWEKVFAE